MNNKHKQITLLVFLIFLLIAINYKFVDDFLVKSFDSSEYGVVERVIDGDTLVINGTSVRLLGINCPEKGEEYYKEAGDFLRSLVLNKTVRLEFGKDKLDRYGRKLAYVFLGRENINLEIVKKGFANPYFPSGRDKYYKIFYDAWENCVIKNINFCETSEEVCAGCIKLVKFDYNNEIIILQNICPNMCDISQWTMKDEGRKKFIFEDVKMSPGKELIILVGAGEDTKEKLFWAGETYVWTKTGDALFLRDKENRIVLWEKY